MSKSLSILFFFLPVVCLAQPKITTSPAFETESKLIVNVLGIFDAGKDDNLLVVYYSEKLVSGFPSGQYRYAWAADVYSPELKKLHGSQLETVKLSNGKNSDYSHAVHFAGAPWLIIQQYHKREKELAVFCCSIDAEGKIGKPKSLGSYPAEDLTILSKVSFHITPDGSTLYVICNPSWWNFKNDVSFIAFDKNWKKLQSGVFNMPRQGRDLRLDGPFLSADGSIWMPAWTESKSDGIAQEIWIWKDPKTTPKRIDLQLDPDKIITDMTFSQSVTDGAIYVGGVYAQATKKTLKSIPRPNFPIEKHPVQGSFYLKIDPENHSILSKYIAPFQMSNLKFWGIDTKDYEKGEGVKSLRAQEIVPQEDKSVLLYLEQSFVIPLSNNTTTGSPITDGSPAAGSSIIQLYGADGKVKREHLIKKRLKSISYSGTGHLLLANQKNQLLLYNDHLDNISSPPSNFSSLKHSSVGVGLSSRKEVSALFYSDSTGKSQIKPAFKFSDTKYWINPFARLQVSPTGFIIACDGTDGLYGLLRVDMPE